MHEIFSTLTIKALERGQLKTDLTYCSGVSIDDFEQVNGS